MRKRLAVGGHRPLGLPGGPRGEHQVGEVTGGDRRSTAGGHVGRARTALGAGRPPTRPPGRPWRSTRGTTAVAGPEDHHPLEVGNRVAGGNGLVEEPGVVGSEETVHREEHPGPRSAQDVCRLGTLESGVEGHKQRPGSYRAESGDHPLGAVGCPDGHPVATVDPVGHDGPGGRGHLVGQLVEGQRSGRFRRDRRTSTTASNSPKRAAASSTSPGMVPHCRSPRGSVTSDTSSG